MKMIKEVQSSDPVSAIILKLGGFHTIMNFLGSIGHLMDGSGLDDLMGQVYATDTVPHMLSGKAISRSIRCHLLIDSALHKLLLRELISDLNPSDELELKSLFDLVLQSPDRSLWKDSPTLNNLNEIYKEKLMTLCESR